jgi:hypothetical protein
MTASGLISTWACDDLRISVHPLTGHYTLGTHHGPMARSTVTARHSGCGHGSNITHVPSTHTSSGTAAHSTSRTTAHGSTARSCAGAATHTAATHHGLGKTITSYQRDSHHANHKNYYKYFFHYQFLLLNC